MKRFRQSLRMVLHEPTLFYGYRWLAWGLAALALALSGSQRFEPAFYGWLLVLIAVFNLLATALSQSYVRVARYRPAILSLDIIASVALVWISGGHILPFMAFALGSLVLPTTLFNWRRGLIASALFVTLDQAALWLSRLQSGASHSFAVADSLARCLIPFLFVIGLASLLALIRRTAAPVQPLAPFVGSQPLPPRTTPSDSVLTQRRSSRFTTSLPPSIRPFEAVSTDTPVAAPLATLRASDPAIEEWRRTLIALTSSTTAELPAALTLLANGFEKRSGIDVQTVVVGKAQVLSRPHYFTLLRLAQESLLNVHQHAHATHVVVTLHYGLEQLTLTVADDGVGLLDGTYIRPGIHALRAIGYRLAEIDGSLAVAEGEQSGVVVRASVPLL